MYSVSQSNFSSLNFGKKSKTTKKFPQGEGYSHKVTAEYSGYTGTKKHIFPTHLDAENYPDITKRFKAFKGAIFDELDKTKSWWGKIKLLRDNFHTGEAWDTKFLKDFPGRDVLGNTQYAKYKGKVISANYLSNNIYGQVMHKVGFSERTSKLIAQLYSHGIVRIFSKGKLPHKDLLKFSDPIEDQRAILSGFSDIKIGMPWKVKNIDPSMPHPKVNEFKINLNKQLKTII